MYRFVAISFLFCLQAMADTTLYKSVDDSGLVTYSDAPPAAALQTEQIEIQQDAVNVSESVSIEALMREQQKADRAAAIDRGKTHGSWSESYRSATQALDDAEQALVDAKVIKEGDMVGSSLGGARPNIAWIERLEGAEADVDAKRKALDRIKRQR